MLVANKLRNVGRALFLLVLLTGCGQEQEASSREPLTEAEALVEAGKQKSRSCMGCHGPQGISRVASYPSLAGQSQEYLQQQLKAFKSGARENPMMSSIARNLSEDDILALSHYYASLPGPEEE